MKYVKCLTIVLTLLFVIGVFAGCGITVVDDDGVERAIKYDQFVKITDTGYWVDEVYDIDSHVVYYLQYGGDRGFLSPKLIYQDGAIYGCIYENGEYIPVPYATN
jgi:hypothetical protein